MLLGFEQSQWKWFMKRICDLMVWQHTIPVLTNMYKKFQLNFKSLCSIFHFMKYISERKEQRQTWFGKKILHWELTEPVFTRWLLQSITDIKANLCRFWKRTQPVHSFTSCMYKFMSVPWSGMPISLWWLLCQPTVSSLLVLLLCYAIPFTAILYYPVAAVQQKLQMHALIYL